MKSPTVGLLHPGGMGSSVATCLRANGHTVLWASEGRSQDSRERAERADLTDVGSVAEVVRRSDIVLSICPPHAAMDVARSAVGSRVFVDANAVSPETAMEISELVSSAGATFVDGAVIGPHPLKPGTTRLYLSGEGAAGIAALFEGTNLEARALPGDSSMPRASALKMCYAAWSKGTDALIMNILAAAKKLGADVDLVAEWRDSKPDLLGRLVAAGWTAETKGWRFIGEMEEIASTFESIGLPGGFHRTAAEVYGRIPRNPGAPQDQETLDRAVATLVDASPDPAKP